MRHFLAVVLLLGLAASAAPQARPAFPAGLTPDMKPDEVRAKLGAPTRVARQVFAYRCLEQWYYAPPQGPPLRLVFDCPRGLQPRLRQVHRIPAAAP